MLHKCQEATTRYECRLPGSRTEDDLIGRREKKAHEGAGG